MLSTGLYTREQSSTLYTVITASGAVEVGYNATGVSAQPLSLRGSCRRRIGATVIKIVGISAQLLSHL